MPKVSILVPVYNVEKYLRECLDSLINQTLADIEIICINDGSTDKSLEILSEYQSKDSRIKVINKENTGYGHSMNIGLDAATGEYIGILESDDFTSTDMYEELYSEAKKYNVDIIKSDWYEYYSKTKECRKSGRVGTFDTKNILNVFNTPSLLKIQASIWSALFRREFLLKNQIRFLETAGASYQDTSFYLKTFMMANSIKLTGKAYVRYRQDNINSSVKSKEKVYCICDEYNEVERYMQAHPQLIEPLIEYIYTLKYRAYFATMLRIDKKYVREFIDRFSDEFTQIYQGGYCREYFFKRNKREELMLLINNKTKFYKHYRQKLRKHKWEIFRKKLISININSSRIKIVLFGKQIVGIG